MCVQKRSNTNEMFWIFMEMTLFGVDKSLWQKKGDALDETDSAFLFI